MKRFIEGETRTQSTLLPAVLDDYITEASPVRVVDVFVDELELVGFGFEGVDPAATGRPAYHPAVLLSQVVRLKRSVGQLLRSSRKIGQNRKNRRAIFV